MMVAALPIGVVLIEKVFGIGGIGQYVADSAMSLDILPVIGYTLMSAFVLIVTTLVIDVVYAYVDPRTRRALL